jgi:rhodanese-related sulfurtransferase
MKRNLTKALSFLKQNYTPLQDIKDEQLRQFLNFYQMEIGDTLTISGKTQSSCVFILDGEAELIEHSGTSRIIRRIDTLNAPICVDENAASFTARHSTLLVRIDLARLDFLLGWVNLSKNEHLTSPVSKWIDSIESPLVFRNLPLENVKKVYEKLETINAAKDEQIIVQGEAGDYFYLIEEGAAEVWQTGLYDDTPKKVATLSAGQHFGEDALIIDGNRNATVIMTQPSVLKRLNKEDFQTLVNNPRVDRVSDKVALAMLNDGAQLLDVRYEEEYEMEHINNAPLIPLNELRDRIDELDKSKQYIIYCHAGPRSSVATYLLKQHGFSAVSLEGGIRDWSHGVVSSI